MVKITLKNILYIFVFINGNFVRANNIILPLCDLLLQKLTLIKAYNKSQITMHINHIKWKISVNSR